MARPRFSWPTRSRRTAPSTPICSPARSSSPGLDGRLQPAASCHAVLSYAVRSRKLSANPATDIDLPRKPAAKKRYPTHQQVADLAAECGEYDVLVLVLAMCGLRYREATALTRADIYIDTARIEVHAGVEPVNGQYWHEPTKTHETRSVPVPPPVLELSRQRIGSAAPERLVFPARTASSRTMSSARCSTPPRLRRACPACRRTNSDTPAPHWRSGRGRPSRRCSGFSVMRPLL
jgi:integrase